MLNYSFIIPHHNSPKLLQRCIDSIPQRDDIEIIVADDNSDNDKHPTILRKDVRIITIDKEHTKGAGHARNVAMAEATGKWLLFADCDDFYEKDFIKELDKYKDSDIDILFWDAYWDIDLKTKKCNRNLYEPILKAYLNDPTNRIVEAKVKHQNNATWCRMYNHNFINQIDVKYEEVPTGNDVWFVQYSGAKAKKIAVINKKLYYYVWTPNSITKGYKSKDAIIQAIINSEKYDELKLAYGAGNTLRPIYRDFLKYVRTHGYIFAIRCMLLKIRLRIKAHLYYQNIIDEPTSKSPIFQK